MSISLSLCTEEQMLYSISTCMPGLICLLYLLLSQQLLGYPPLKIAVNAVFQIKFHLTIYLMYNKISLSK